MEQALSEIDSVRSTLSEHSRKLEVQEKIAQQNSAKLDDIIKQLASMEQRRPTTASD